MCARHYYDGGELVPKSCLILETQRAVACQDPLSIVFPRQGYCSGLPFPSPGDLPSPGIEPRFLTWQAYSLPAETQGKPQNTGVGSLSLLQGIFLIQESNHGLLHCRWSLYYWAIREAQPLLHIFTSVQFSCSVMSDSLRPHGLQHPRLPCPSPTPRAYSNSCPSSQWWHPIISSSVVPLPSHLSLSHHQGLFKWVSSLQQVAKVLEFQLKHQSFQWTLRTDLLQDGLVGSPCSPGDSQESSPTPQFKSINSSVLSFLWKMKINRTTKGLLLKELLF